MYIADGKMPQITITKIATIFDEEKNIYVCKSEKKQKNTRKINVKRKTASFNSAVRVVDIFLARVVGIGFLRVVDIVLVGVVVVTIVVQQSSLVLFVGFAWTEEDVLGNPGRWVKTRRITHGHIAAVLYVELNTVVTAPYPTTRTTILNLLRLGGLR